MNILVIDDDTDVWCGNVNLRQDGLLGTLKSELSGDEAVNVSIVEANGNEKFVLNVEPDARSSFRFFVRIPEAVGLIEILQRLREGRLTEADMSEWLSQHCFDFYIFDYAWNSTKVPEYRNQEAKYFLAQVEKFWDVTQAVIATGNTEQREEERVGVRAATKFRRLTKEHMKGLALAIQQAPCQRELRCRELNWILNSPESGVCRFFHGADLNPEGLSNAIDRLGDLTKKECTLLPQCRSILSSKWGICTWVRENPGVQKATFDFHSGFQLGSNDCAILAQFLESTIAETPPFLIDVKCSPGVSATVCKLLRKVRPPANPTSIYRVVFPRLGSGDQEWFSIFFKACVPPGVTIDWNNRSLGGIIVNGPPNHVLTGEHANDAVPKAAVPLLWFSDFLDGTFFPDLVKAVAHPVIVASTFAVKAEPKVRCFVIRCEEAEFSLADFGSHCKSQFQGASRYTKVFAAARIGPTVVVYELFPGMDPMLRRTPTLRIGALSVGFEQLQRGAAWCFAVPTI